MSTILNTNGTELEVPQLLDAANFKCAVFTAEWNAEVTDALLKGVTDTLGKAGVNPDNIFSQPVPGTVELVNAAGMAMRHLQDLSAIIILGCVVRGDTPHFDYVCQVVSQGVAELNARGEAPVIFGVLTVNDMQQALDRAGGRLGNKGAEAAVAAIKMANLHIHSGALRYASFRQ